MDVQKRSYKARDTKVEWTERVVSIQRVTKVVKGGKKLSFRAVLVVGDEKGQVGVGVGKASDVITAVRKGVTDAKKNIILVPLTSSDSIPHKTDGRFGAAKLVLRPSAPGSGVIAGGSIRTVLEIAGVKNILSKQLGSNNLLNNARATINGLKALRPYQRP
nr:ribosomal protein S5 [Ochrosphaera neapolitana]